jgi:hypothetical protein
MLWYTNLPPTKPLLTGQTRTRRVLQGSHYRQERGENEPVVVATCVNGSSAEGVRGVAFPPRLSGGAIE